MVQILLTPDTWGRHGMDQICAREKRNANLLPISISGLNTATDGIDLMVEVVQDDGSRLIILLCRLPRIHHQPVGGLVHSQLTHCDTIGKLISILRSAWKEDIPTGDLRWPNQPCDRRPTPGTSSLQ
jgi:hypothetical protein